MLFFSVEYYVIHNTNEWTSHRISIYIGHKRSCCSDNPVAMEKAAKLWYYVDDLILFKQNFCIIFFVKSWISYWYKCLLITYFIFGFTAFCKKKVRCTHSYRNSMHTVVFQQHLVRKKEKKLIVWMDTLKMKSFNSNCSFLHKLSLISITIF